LGRPYGFVPLADLSGALRLCGRGRTFDLRDGQMIGINTVELIGYLLFIKNLAETIVV
jgi:hypothetical protein